MNNSKSTSSIAFNKVTNSPAKNYDTKSLFAIAMGIAPPWTVGRIEFTEGSKELHLYLETARGTRYSCMHCSGSHTAHDKVSRTWKHLRFFEHPTFIHAEVPRIYCQATGKTSNVSLPWARPESGFTLLFEAFVLELSQQMPMTVVGEMTGESGQVIFRILNHYVNVARAREDWSSVSKLGLDETSIAKGHNYLTSMVDLERSKVLSLTPGKDNKVVGILLKDLGIHGGSKDNIKQVSADLSRAFRKGVRDELPDVVITSDRFHVMQLVSKAQDKVRQREYSTSKSKSFKNTRFALLSNPDNQTDRQKQLIEQMKQENNETVQAYNMRLILKDIYDRETIKTAEDSMKAWVEIARESGIPEMVKVADTMEEYLGEIVQYFSSRITNGVVEGINTVIQMIKRRAKGFRNLNNFMTIIYLKCGKLTFNLPRVLAYPL